MSEAPARQAAVNADPAAVAREVDSGDPDNLRTPPRPDPGRQVASLPVTDGSATERHDPRL